MGLLDQCFNGNTERSDALRLSANNPTASFFNLLNRCLDGDAEISEALQLAANNSKRRLASTLLDTLQAHREVKESLGPFGTSDSVWGPGGTLDRQIANDLAELDASVKAAREARHERTPEEQKAYEERIWQEMYGHLEKAPR